MTGWKKNASVLLSVTPTDVPENRATNPVPLQPNLGLVLSLKSTRPTHRTPAAVPPSIGAPPVPADPAGPVPPAPPSPVVPAPPAPVAVPDPPAPLVAPPLPPPEVVTPEVVAPFVVVEIEPAPPVVVGTPSDSELHAA